ncbi:RNA helicase, DEAD-box type [Nannochloropsis gaditana]|uniref:RNA helicase n=1 Tax=Nannochloropsis gaditana TaxID=72520 RepID=W7TSQ0_9STRA|nr:RNA helicase, DEAD-box type [Nannochloropsis gaditana]
MGKDELSMKEEEKEARERKLRKKAKKESKRAAELLKISEAETAETEVKEPADKLLNGTTNEKQDEQSSILRLSKEERKRAKKEKKKQEKIAAATSHATPLPSTPCTADAPHPLSKSEAQAWWEENEILVSGPGCDAFLPTLSFAGVGFPPDLLKCTEGFARPTPIQAQCWPVLMGGRDIIGIAETGSGKTLTFVLPGLERIRKAGAPDGGGVDILVATPGRLADLMEEGECDLSRVSYLVLDEADRMLDQGFEQAIRGIVSHCVPRGRRQTALFSATWPVAIQALAGEFLENPVKVTIGGEDLSSNKRVQQVVEVVGEFEREGRLRGLLTQYHGRRDNRVLVFALYKKEASRLELNLQRQGYKCLGIHGDKSQSDRIAAIEKFKTKEVPLLVATDVAARGLDIPDVEVVINYSFPLTIEDYVHR